MSQYALGIDIGGTNIQCAVLDDDAAIVGRTHAETEPARGLEHVLDSIAAGARGACRAAGIELEQLSAVGVVSAGVIDAANGVVIIAENLGWSDVPLRRLLTDRLGHPVALENDANGAVWGEHRAGAASGGGDVLGVWLGTGVGAGLVIGGCVARGDFHTTGEIGHTVLGTGQPIVEDVCSRPALLQAVAEGLAAHPDSSLAGAPVSVADVGAAWQAGDALAVEVVERATAALGLAIANTVTLLAMRNVVIGGGVTEALGPAWIERVRARFEETVFPEACRACEIRMTALAADAGLIGAALLAREAHWQAD